MEGHGATGLSCDVMPPGGSHSSKQGPHNRVRNRGARRLAGPVLLAGLALVQLHTGCAMFGGSGGVPIDSRPTPPQPPPADSTQNGDSSGASTDTGIEQPPPQGEVAPEERQQMLARISADTTAAGIVIRRCASRQLLPDQEATFDSARDLLSRTRLALEADEVWRAESLARRARQLAAALRCP